MHFPSARCWSGLQRDAYQLQHSVKFQMCNSPVEIFKNSFHLKYLPTSQSCHIQNNVCLQVFVSIENTIGKNLQQIRLYFRSIWLKKYKDEPIGLQRRCYWSRLFYPNKECEYRRVLSKADQQNFLPNKIRRASFPWIQSTQPVIHLSSK
jgi:hypothetical protein